MPPRRPCHCRLSLMMNRSSPSRRQTLSCTTLWQ
jgi:hypothetical protein